jgi:hypothetical protein
MVNMTGGRTGTHTTGSQAMIFSLFKEEGRLKISHLTENIKSAHYKHELVNSLQQSNDCLFQESYGTHKYCTSKIRSLRRVRKLAKSD